MMTKWDTIQLDVADQYIYIDEEEEYNKALDNDEDELGKALTLDWKD